MKMLSRNAEIISKNKTEKLDSLPEWGLHRDMIIFKNASLGQVWEEKES